ncbi:MAG TPA: hypothetical protein VGB10_06365 [Bacteroidota bacterium]
MKKPVAMLLGILIAALVSSASMTAQDKKMEKEMTVTGEVVDVACYLSRGAKGEGHIRCAQACAKGGGALGLLAADGKLYVSLLPDDHKNSPNAILMDHIGMNIEAKGFVRAKGGTQGMMIRSVAAAQK